MIYLNTGQPGAGKTLYTIVWAMEEFKDRPVYYSGIADCRVPGWVELDDATQWHKLPAGSVVVIDEAQRVFRPRGSGSVVPEHVAQLETHRHSGIDVVMITQHPMLVDSNIRRLVGMHQHVVRAWGTHRAVVHRWDECKEQCGKTRTDSIKKQFVYPSSAFGLYRSAEVHTHKRRIPPRVWFLILAPLIILGAGYGVYQWMSSRAKPKGPDAPQFVATSSQPATTPTLQGRSSATSAPMTEQEQTASLQNYLQTRAPRLPGLAHTAPIYDKLTEPTLVPHPAGCVRSAARGCKCFTEQATPLDVPASVCEGIVAGGYFVGWRKESRVEGQPQPARVASASTTERKLFEPEGKPPISILEDSAPAGPDGGSWVGSRGKALPASGMKK